MIRHGSGHRPTAAPPGRPSGVSHPPCSFRTMYTRHTNDSIRDSRRDRNRDLDAILAATQAMRDAGLGFTVVLVEPAQAEAPDARADRPSLAA